LDKLAKTKDVYKLSNSALETLSIIAYKQPLTRAEVEHIPGVDSGGVIHNLLEKRLVRITGRKEVLGHPLLYGTSDEFLQYFGLASIADLPMLEDLNKS
jgi:segregation and condensation protein B